MGFQPLNFRQTHNIGSLAPKSLLGILNHAGLFDEIIQYNLVDSRYQPDPMKIVGFERPPMIEIPEYCEKFNIKN